MMIWQTLPITLLCRILGVRITKAYRWSEMIRTAKSQNWSMDMNFTSGRTLRAHFGIFALHGKDIKPSRLMLLLFIRTIMRNAVKEPCR
jgi:hypothetical protein